jgi:hypothetical protein
VRLQFDGAAKGAIETVEIDITTVMIASQPTAPRRLTQAETPGIDRSLFAQPVLVGGTNRLWLTVGAISPDVCPIARQAWRFEEIEPHWDRLVVRALADDRLIREEQLAEIGSARDLIVQATGSKRLGVGVALFCGAPSASNPQPSCRKGLLELVDAVLGRTISYAYP